MDILEKVLWAESQWVADLKDLAPKVRPRFQLAPLPLAGPLLAPDKHITFLLTDPCVQELLELVRLAHMWQLEDVMNELPSAIQNVEWDPDEERSALADLYAACDLPEEVYEAAILELLGVARVDLAELLRLVPSPRGEHLRLIFEHNTPGGREVGLDGAAKYLSSAQLPLLRFSEASSMLRVLDKKAAKQAASKQAKAGALLLLNALQCLEHAPPLLCTPVLYFPAPGSVGVACSVFNRCIKDMFQHYLRCAIEGPAWSRPWDGSISVLESG